MTTDAPDILAGINVVEFSQNLAIPHCGRLLAGLGANVVKVEPPQGDAMRNLATVAPGEGKAFAVINPGKRGIVVDLGSPEASEVIAALFAWADIALVAFKRDDLDRYGISWDQAKAINPSLIHVTHTAFGPLGPDAALGGYDVLVQGRSGIGFVMNRSSDGKPDPTRPAINDVGTGVMSAFAVMAALRHRDQTGEGQRVDTSLLGTAVDLGTPILNHFPDVDTEPLAELKADLAVAREAGLDFDVQRGLYESRVLSGGGLFALYFRHYRTADGLISIAGASPSLMAKFHDITGVAQPTTPDPNEPGFRAAVDQAEELFTTRTTDEWIAELREAGYPCGPYNLPYEAIDDPQVRENGFVVELDHPTFGPYATTGMPISFEKNRAELRGPSPRFGEHTREVLEEVGVSPERVTELLEQQVLLDKPPSD